ncbi:MAG: TonB-dependent siderophore receptor [Pseudomonadota bacterium]
MTIVKARYTSNVRSHISSMGFKSTLSSLLLSSSLLVLSAAPAIAQSSNTNVSQEDVIIVTGKRIQSGYLEEESDVGFGFPADIARVPQSIQVINERLINDLNPSTLSDIIGATAGVGAPRNSVEPFSSFKLRGFTVSQTIVDGIRNTNALNIQAEGLANIESVEILRGPGGAVYGLSSPGGVINVVSKKPLTTPRYEAALSVGNFDEFQGQADLTGPLSSDGSLRYRVTGAYENRDSFIDFVGVERTQIAPTLEWEPIAGTVLRYQGDYRRREGLRFISLPLEGTLINTDAFELPFSLFTGEPDQGDTVSEAWVHTFTIERNGDGANQSKVYARYTDTEYDQPSVAPGGVQDDGRTLDRRFNRFVEEQEEIIVGAQIVREIEVGGLNPIISAGIDYADWTYDSVFNRGSVGPLDLLAPVYGAPIGDTFVLANSIDSFQQIGGYLQGVVELSDDITVLLGARVDRLENETTSLRSGASGSRTDTQVSPRAGISWEIAPGVVPYASFARTFEANPNFGFVRSPDGTPFGPQTGRQWEAGVKLAAVAGLTSTISFFDIELRNVLTADPADPFFRIPTGEQRSRGVEFINTWEPIDALTILGSYAYTDAIISQDTNLPSGTRLENVPEHSGRIWARYAYDFGGKWFGGLTGGWTYNSAAAIGIATTLEIPSYNVLEAGAFLGRGPLVASLTVDNLVDNEYLIRGAFGGNGVVPGDARRILFTLAWRP